MPIAIICQCVHLHLPPGLVLTLPYGVGILSFLFGTASAQFVLPQSRGATAAKWARIISGVWLVGLVLFEVAISVAMYTA